MKEQNLLDELNATDFAGHSGWFMAVADVDKFKSIPKHLFTAAILRKKSAGGDSLLHAAAALGTLDIIPQHLLTHALLNKRNKERDTVWHEAAISGNLEQIPNDLFTQDALKLINKNGESVLECILNSYFAVDQIKKVPIHLIDNEIFELKARNGKQLLKLLNRSGAQYVKNAIFENLNRNYINFIHKNPSLEKGTEFRDPRLILHKATPDELVFTFTGINDMVTFSKSGAILNHKVFESLNQTVMFIQNTYFEIEHKLTLPRCYSCIIDNFLL